LSFCPNCGKEIQADATFCSNCGHNLKQVAQKVSKLWWLLPIFFTIIGGILAYVANRERNSKTARTMLILGIVLVPVFVISIFAIAIAVFA
jgi:predicted nucleic acid-binding Zn ribbon protein